MWAGNQYIWKWCYTMATTVLALSTGPGCYTGEPWGSKPTAGHPIDSMWHELGASDPSSEISWCYSWSICIIMFITARHQLLVDFKSTCITFQSTWNVSCRPSDMLWNIMADLVIKKKKYDSFCHISGIFPLKSSQWWNVCCDEIQKLTSLMKCFFCCWPTTFFIFHELKIICWCLL